MVTYTIFLSSQLLIKSAIWGISQSWEKAMFWNKIDSVHNSPLFFADFWFFSSLVSSSHRCTLSQTKPGDGSTSYVLLLVPCHRNRCLPPWHKIFRGPALPVDLDPYTGHSPLHWMVLPYLRSCVIPYTSYLYHYLSLPTSFFISIATLCPPVLFSCTCLMCLFPPCGSHLPGA